MNSHLRQRNVVSWRVRHQRRRLRHSTTTISSNNHNHNSSIPTIIMFSSNSSKRSPMRVYRKTKRSKPFYANWTIVRWDLTKTIACLSFSFFISRLDRHWTSVNLCLIRFFSSLLCACALSRRSSNNKSNNWRIARRTAINCALWSMNVRMNCAMWSRRMNN